MKIFNAIWYGVYGMIVFPLGVVICVVNAVESHNTWTAIGFSVLAAFFFMCGKTSLRKMRANL